MAQAQELETTKFSPEKEKELEAAIKLLEDAAERHEQTLPDDLSAQEMDDLYQAADLYKQCKGDRTCAQQHLRFALDNFTEQISNRREVVKQFLKAKKTSLRDQSRSEQMKGWGASAEFKERYGSDPLKDLADLNREYAGKPQMIETDEEKIRCYQTAKFLKRKIENDIIKPMSENEKKAANFAYLAIQELEGEVEALLAEKELKPAA